MKEGEKKLTKSIEVPIGNIDASPFQLRQLSDPERDEALKRSIEKEGLLVRPLVRPSPRTPGRYELVHGHRRLKACHELNWESISVDCRDLNDGEAAAAALAENMEREDLNPIEEAQGFQLLIEEFHMTQEQVAKRFGVSRPYVANSIALLRMPFFLTSCVLCKTLTPWQARAIMALPGGFRHYRLADLSMDWRLGPREIRRIVKEMRGGAKVVIFTREVIVEGCYFWRDDANEVVYDGVLPQEGVRPLVLADGLVLNGEAEVRDTMMKGVQLIEADVGFLVDWLREAPVFGRIMEGGSSRGVRICPPMTDKERRRTSSLCKMLTPRMDEYPVLVVGR